MAWLGGPLLSITSIPLLGIGIGGAGLFYGTFDVTWKLGGILVPVRNPKGWKEKVVGFGGGFGAGAVTYGLREVFLKPKFPEFPQGANSLQRVVHILRNYPYAFRVSSIASSAFISAVTARAVFVSLGLRPSSYAPSRSKPQPPDASLVAPKPTSQSPISTPLQPVETEGEKTDDNGTDGKGRRSTKSVGRVEEEEERKDDGMGGSEQSSSSATSEGWMHRVGVVGEKVVDGASKGVELVRKGVDKISDLFPPPPSPASTSRGKAVVTDLTKPPPSTPSSPSQPNIEEDEEDKVGARAEQETWAALQRADAKRNDANGQIYGIDNVHGKRVE